MFSSNRAKENGGPTPKRMKTRQNKDSVREVGEGGGTQEAKLQVWVGTEAPCKASGHGFGMEFGRGFGMGMVLVECKGFRGFGSLSIEEEWWEVQSRTDTVIPLSDVNAEWTEERDSGAPRGAQVTGSSFPWWRQHLQQ